MAAVTQEVLERRREAYQRLAEDERRCFRIIGGQFDATNDIIVGLFVPIAAVRPLDSFQK